MWKSTQHKLDKYDIEDIREEELEAEKYYKRLQEDEDIFETQVEKDGRWKWRC